MAKFPGDWRLFERLMGQAGQRMIGIRAAKRQAAVSNVATMVSPYSNAVQAVRHELPTVQVAVNVQVNPTVNHESAMKQSAIQPSPTPTVKPVSGAKHNEVPSNPTPKVNRESVVTQNATNSNPTSKVNHESAARQNTEPSHVTPTVPIPPERYVEEIGKYVDPPAPMATSTEEQKARIFQAIQYFTVPIPVIGHKLYSVLVSPTERMRQSFQSSLPPTEFSDLLTSKLSVELVVLPEWSLLDMIVVFPADWDAYLADRAAGVQKLKKAWKILKFWLFVNEKGLAEMCFVDCCKLYFEGDSKLVIEFLMYG
jgi:hypothetical protein